MRFSVVIPTHNREKSLRRCLLAVTSQDYPDYEMIVVDDASQDGTADMVSLEFPHAIYLRQRSNLGPAAARNRGIREATGEVIAFTDDDCVPPSNWLFSLSAGFETYPEASAVGGLQEPPEEIWKQNPLARYERYRTRKVYKLGDGVKIGYPLPMGTNNLAIKKRLLIQVGGFDELFPVAAGEDADLLHRLVESGNPTVCLPMSVIHRQTYTWPSFFRQQIRRGVGAAYFLAKRKMLPGLTKEYLHFFALPVLFGADLSHSHSVQIAFVSTLSRLCQTLGRLQARARVADIFSTHSSLQSQAKPKIMNAPEAETAAGEEK
jgi:GT2 family glycosyltransferase